MHQRASNFHIIMGRIRCYPFSATPRHVVIQWRSVCAVLSHRPQNLFSKCAVIIRGLFPVPTVTLTAPMEKVSTPPLTSLLYQHPQDVPASGIYYWSHITDVLSLCRLDWPLNTNHHVTTAVRIFITLYRKAYGLYSMCDHNVMLPGSLQSCLDNFQPERSFRARIIEILF